MGGHPGGAPQPPDTLHKSRPHCCSGVASVGLSALHANEALATATKGPKHVRYSCQGLSSGFLHRPGERSTSRRSLTKDSAMQDEAIRSAAARHVYIWLRAGSEDPAGGWWWRSPGGGNVSSG